MIVESCKQKNMVPAYMGPKVIGLIASSDFPSKPYDIEGGQVSLLEKLKRDN